MGWLGWTPEVVFATDVNVLQLGLEGRNELLVSIFGSGSPTKSSPMTSDRFRAFAHRHNRRYAKEKMPGQSGEG